MDIAGEERIAAPRDAVWKALNDPDILKACISGCEKLEWISDRKLEATVGIKLSLIKARFSGTIELSNLNPPHSYTISAEGKGGLAGFAKGAADVTLIEEGNETVLVYRVNADVGGKIAHIGSRLVSSWATKLAARFFEKLGQVATRSSQLP